MVALFVGLGVAAFYEAPKEPEYPELLSEPMLVKEGVSQESEGQKTARREYNKEQKEFRKLSSIYNRNVSIVAMIAAVIILVISLRLVTKILLMSDGLLLGGVLTLLYSLIRGFMAEDAKYRFVAVTIGLFIALVVGFLKFIRHEEK